MCTCAYAVCVDFGNCIAVAAKEYPRFGAEKAFYIGASERNRERERERERERAREREREKERERERETETETDRESEREREDAIVG